MIYKQRDYQSQGLQQLRENYDAGRNRLLGFMATGLGKSSGIAMNIPVAFPDLVDRYGMIFIVHRREILMDTYAKFKAAYPDKWIGIEMGEGGGVVEALDDGLPPRGHGFWSFG